jgi:UDP-N-acetylmuramate dehydrogenase
MIEAHSEADLALAREAVSAGEIPVLVVGKGSNLLVADRGFPGLVVTLGDEFADIEIDEHGVRAGAIVSLPVLARKTAAAGLSGLEWAVGVPGSVGGAVRMNAGGHGSQTAQSLRRYRFIDLYGAADGTRDAAHLELSYRHSSIQAHQVVVWAEFELIARDVAGGEAELSEIVRWRRANQPGGRNAGSVFTNPPGDSAGRLIDAAGLKGLRVGSATVSEKHANFIQSEEGGLAGDVLNLVAQVQAKVKETHGVTLEPEIRFVGFSPAELDGVVASGVAGSRP